MPWIGWTNRPTAADCRAVSISVENGYPWQSVEHALGEARRLIENTATGAEWKNSKMPNALCCWKHEIVMQNSGHKKREKTQKVIRRLFVPSCVFRGR
jgi:hypothetical protein